MHMNATELRALVAAEKSATVARRAHERERRIAARLAGWPQPPDPACWSWEITAEDREEVARLGVDALARWQVDQCGACGDWSTWVEDHDHETGYTRGMLCRRCNGIEPGAEPGSLLHKWRTRSAATLFGLSETYIDPFTRHAGPTRPRATDLTRHPTYAITSLIGAQTTPETR